MAGRDYSEQDADDDAAAIILMHNPSNPEGRRTAMFSNNDLRHIRDNVPDKDLSARVHAMIPQKK